MADRIKGITIEIGGDTTALSEALRGVNSEIRQTQSQLKDVEKLLKLDPGNTDLLAQKERLLNQEVEKTEEKLKALEKAQEQVNEAFEKGEASIEQVEALQREIVATKNAFDEAKKNAAAFNKTLEGMSEKAAEVSKKAGEIADKTAGISKAGAAGLATVGALVGKSVANYAEYEQLVGGVETLFKDSAGALVEYANQAYKTAGLNANNYMETVTSFSASLISSLEGDTAAAAEKANRAIIDMSDNANKFGSDITSLQNAYSGFAKGQFNMLDNLKLGYGGTKAEMERLLEDAEAISGIHYNVENYADIVDAIHIVQENLGIAGATAQESATTIEGSLNSVKASFDNLLTGFAVEGADIQALVENVAENIKNLLSNLKPVLATIWENIPAVGKMGIAFLGFMAIISPIAKTVSTVAGAITGVTKAYAVLQPALAAAKLGMAAFKAEMLLTLAPIAAVVAAVVGLAFLIYSKSEEIKNILNNVDNFLQNIFAADFTNIFGPILGGVLNHFFDAFQLIWSNIKTVLDGVISFIQAVFSGNWQAAWDAVKGIFTGVFDNIYNFATEKLQGVIDFINKIIGLAGEALDKLNEVAQAGNDSKGNRVNGGNQNHNTWSAWDAITNAGLPLMANGGSIVGSGAAIVGEAGPELLSLSNGRATVTPINVTMNNTFGNYNNAAGAAAARDLARQIDMQLGRNYK